MDTSKTLTKRDCENIIRDYKRMAEACETSIESLKELSRRIGECADTVEGWKKSFDVDKDKRKSFIKTIQNYLELHGFKGVFNDDKCCDITTIEFIDENGYYCMAYSTWGGQRPCEVRIFWQDVVDIHDTISGTLDYIDRYVLKKDN